MNGHNDPHPEPFTDLMGVLPALREFLAKLPEIAPQESQAQQAVRTVWTAVDTTKMYLRRRRGGHEEQQPNPELVELWRRAAVAIAPYDARFALRLREKAEYWSDPIYWQPQQIQEGDIAIDAVAGTARDLLRLFSAHSTMPSSPAGDNSYDFFISYASEDRLEIARPLADALSRTGFAVWLDESLTAVGDNLLSTLDRGLTGSRFGVLILSRVFFDKPWPKMELAAFLALEAADGRKRLLPVRHRLSHAELVQKSPILAGRVAVSTEGGLDLVVQQLSRSAA